MNIGIDARLYGLKHAGIGRYTKQLIHHLAKLNLPNQFTLFTDNPKAIEPLPENFNIVLAPQQHYTISEQTSFLTILNNSRCDLVHFPHFNAPLFYKKPFVVTIHDLLWHQRVGFSATTLTPPIYLLKYLGYRLVIGRAITRSQAIFTPTKFVKDAVSSTFKIAKGKITVTPEAASKIFSTTPKKSNFVSKLNISRPFVVYTGSLYPHKNVNALINAISLSKDVNLVIVSSRNIFQQKTRNYVKSKKLFNRIHFLGFLDDSNLVSIYKHSQALILPSVSEGFGLTGLEAMSANTPVICTDTPVLREVYGKAALFTDTNNPKNIHIAISKLLKNPKLKKSLINKGKIQAAKYSWIDTAKTTYNKYLEVLDRP